MVMPFTNALFVFFIQFSETNITGIYPYKIDCFHSKVLMKIGILGSVEIGLGLGTGLVKLGNTVKIGTPDPCKEEFLTGLAIMVAAKREKRRLKPSQNLRLLEKYLCWPHHGQVLPTQ